MGGNALKNTHTRRYELDEFHQAYGMLCELLENDFPIERFDLVQHLYDKQNFGDMDILVLGDKNGSLQAIFKHFGDVEVAARYDRHGHVSSDVISFPLDQLQVDLIFCDEASYEFNRDYFAYGDLGNLIGCISRQAGFKFGGPGLRKKLMDDTNQIDDVVVTNDFRDAIDFLGFDVGRYDQGFSNQEEVNQFVINSRYFDPDGFRMSNRNHKARVRYQKRPGYQSFLQAMPDTKNADVPSKEEFLSKAFNRFPDFRQRYEHVAQQHENQKEVKQRFNGKVVGEATGLKGERLGLFIESFKGKMEKEDFQQYVLTASDERIKKDVQSHCHRYFDYSDISP